MKARTCLVRKHPSLTLIIAIAFGITLSSGAQASEAPEGQPGYSHGLLGLGLHLGFYQSSGAGLLLGTEHVGAELSGGYRPLLIGYQDGVGRGELVFIHSAQLEAEGRVKLFTIPRTTHFGLKGGYRFNHVLGHGGALGGYAQKDFSESLGLRGMWGIAIYPEAENRLREREGLGSVRFNFPPVLDWGLTVGVVFYP